MPEKELFLIWHAPDRAQIRRILSIWHAGGSKSSKIGGLGFFNPLLRGVVASGGPRSSKIEDL